MVLGFSLLLSSFSSTLLGLCKWEFFCVLWCTICVPKSSYISQGQFYGGVPVSDVESVWLSLDAIVIVSVGICIMVCDSLASPSIVCMSVVVFCVGVHHGVCTLSVWLLLSQDF